jgi:hypothetical protein
VVGLHGLADHRALFVTKAADVTNDDHSKAVNAAKEQ